MGMLPNLMGRWFKLHGKFLHLQAEASEKAGMVSAVTKFVQVSLQSLVLGFGALLVIEGKITPGMMIAASILVGRALAPVQQVIGVWKIWSAARAAPTTAWSSCWRPTRRATPAWHCRSRRARSSVEDVTAAPPGSQGAGRQGPVVRHRARRRARRDRP